MAQFSITRGWLDHGQRRCRPPLLRPWSYFRLFVAAYVWGYRWQRLQVEFPCDNHAVVVIIIDSSRDPRVPVFWLLSRGLAVSSWRRYAPRMKKFWSFCDLSPKLFPSSTVPISEYQLIMFVSWLAQSLSPASVEVYHIDWGFNDPTQTNRLRRVLQGIHRSHVGSSVPRRPITRESLCSIHRILSVPNSGIDSLMFWSACSLTFFGFLRVSEFTSSGDRALRFRLSSCPHRR